MENLPQDVRAIVLDYKAQLEHVGRFKKTLKQIYPMYRCMCRLRMNREFHGIFFPAWWDLLNFFGAFGPIFPNFQVEEEEEEPPQPNILHLM